MERSLYSLAKTELHEATWPFWPRLIWPIWLGPYFFLPTARNIVESDSTPLFSLFNHFPISAQTCLFDSVSGGPADPQIANSASLAGSRLRCLWVVFFGGIVRVGGPVPVIACLRANQSKRSSRLNLRNSGPG